MKHLEKNLVKAEEINKWLDEPKHDARTEVLAHKP